MPYAIRNRKTKKRVYGTDYRYYPHHQRTSFEECLIFRSYETAKCNFRQRRCGKDYEIVSVKIISEGET